MEPQVRDMSVACVLAAATAWPGTAWAQNNDCTGTTANRQSVSTFSSLLDGQPGTAGQPQVAGTASVGDDVLTLDGAFGFTPSARQGVCDMLLSISSPNVFIPLSDGATQTQDVVGLSWEQRWRADDANGPTLSSYAAVEIPFGGDSDPFEMIVAGILARSFPPGTIYLNLTLQNQNDLTVQDWQAGALLGWRHDLANGSSLVFDGGAQPGGGPILEISWQQPIGADLVVGPGLSWASSDGEGEVTFGIAVQLAFGS